MKKMMGTKGNIIRHIRSARQWLERAEQAFDLESTARGELDLILARAEMQHAQEGRFFARGTSLKAIMQLSRYAKTLGVMAGGAVVFGLLILPSVRYLVQPVQVNFPPPSLEPKTQLEIPATFSIKTSNSIISPLDNQEMLTETALGGNPEISFAAGDGSRNLIKNDNTVAKTVKEAKTAIQTSAKAPITYDVLGLLMRTAERVLKSTN